MENSSQAPASLLCPSAQSDWKDAMVFGIVGGTLAAPRVAYLVEPQRINDELVRLADAVQPTEVFRIAAPCAGSDCVHFDGAHCQLVSRTVQYLSPVTEKLPICRIRASCRWWVEEGKVACFRCPQVITNNFIFTDELLLAATPSK